MSILDNTAIFVAVIQQGGFSHAAKHLGVSNGLISRRIAELEAELGVTLIKRNTRQWQLTPEGKLFWEHAEHIQQILLNAVSHIHATANQPAGILKISGPFYFGRHYLTPIMTRFMKKYPDIRIELDLSNEKHDLVKEQWDLIIRGAGYINEELLKTSNLRAKLLLKDKIGLYASNDYLQKTGRPRSAQDLSKHIVVSHMNKESNVQAEKWKYEYKGKTNEVAIIPQFKCNDIESSLITCINGHGIGKFTAVTVKKALKKDQLVPVLTSHDWGQHNLYVLYSNQKNLPQRTRLLLDFIYAATQEINNIRR